MGSDCVQCGSLANCNGSQPAAVTITVKNMKYSLLTSAQIARLKDLWRKVLQEQSGVDNPAQVGMADLSEGSTILHSIIETNVAGSPQDIFTSLMKADATKAITDAADVVVPNNDTRARLGPFAVANVNVQPPSLATTVAPTTTTTTTT